MGAELRGSAAARRGGHDSRCDDSTSLLESKFPRPGRGTDLHVLLYCTVLTNADSGSELVELVLKFSGSARAADPPVRLWGPGERRAAVVRMSC